MNESSRLITAIISLAGMFAPLSALADPPEAVKAFNSSDPLGAIVYATQGCTLVRPMYPPSAADEDPAESTAGNISIPLKVSHSVVDLGQGESICAVKKVRPNPVTKFPFVYGLSHRADASASLKLKFGSWLNLVDFDAKNLETMTVGFEGGAVGYTDGPLGAAARDIKDSGLLCLAWKKKSAKIISRNCVGNVYLGFSSTQGVTLNALDITVGQLTVGLKASWVKEIKGSLKKCDPNFASAVASASSEKKTEAPDATKTEAKPPAAANGIQLKSGDKSIKLTTEGLTLPSAIIDVTPLSKTEKPKAADATADQKPKVEVKKDSAATVSGSKNIADEPCITEIVYRTTSPVIYGVAFRPAKEFIDYAEQAAKTN